MSKFVALVVAGGNSSRIEGSVLPKQYLDFSGKTLLQCTIEALLMHPEIEHVQLVANPLHEAYYLPVVQAFSKHIISVAEAGERRTDSVFSGLKALEDYQPDYVLIHDAVRPFTSFEVIGSVINALLNGAKGVVPLVPLQDTIVKRKGSFIGLGPDRNEVAAVQTPQGFDFHEILLAYNNYFQNSHEDYTDDGSLALSQGIEVQWVPGDIGNFKITSSFDVKLAAFLLSQAR